MKQRQSEVSLIDLAGCGDLSREGCHCVLGVTTSLTLGGIETKYGGSSLRMCLFLQESRDLVAICRGSGGGRVKEGTLKEQAL